MFNSKEACFLSGVTYRQLDYWCRTGIIPDTANGSGTRRQFQFEDVVALRLIAAITASIGQDKFQFIVTTIKKHAETYGYKGYAVIEYENRGIWFAEESDLEDMMKYNKIISSLIVNLTAVESSVRDKKLPSWQIGNQ